MDGMKNEGHSGGNLQDYMLFPPRSFVSPAAIESVFYCVYNEYFLRETKKEDREEGKEDRRGRGRLRKENKRVLITCPVLLILYPLKCFVHL